MTMDGVNVAVVARNTRKMKLIFIGVLSMGANTSKYQLFLIMFAQTVSIPKIIMGQILRKMSSYRIKQERR